MATNKKDIILQRAANVSEEYKADVYLYSGQIDDNGYGSIIKAIVRGKKLDNALLILTTRGGQANAAYQIARLFQKMYDKFSVCTPSYCKSAGTIIALGAHRLIMDVFSELGPLDVQLLKENEIGARRSGLLARSSFESLQEISFELYEHFMLSITRRSQGLVSFRVASELSASMTASLLAPVYGQINPDVVGSDFRDLNVAMHYGDRLVDIANNAKLGTVLRLVHKYPSHDFIIDNHEAQELFKNIDEPSGVLYSLLGCLGEIAYKEQLEPFVAYDRRKGPTGG